jgi:hypothetical protein
MDRRIAQDKIIGFALGLGNGKTNLNAIHKTIGTKTALFLKQDRTATGSDFSGEVDTTQYTLSSYGGG